MWSERELRRRLLRADAAGDDVRLEIVLARDRRAGEAAEHRELAAVRDRIGDRALEELLLVAREGSVGREKVVEFLRGGEETFAFGGPRLRRRVVPLPFAARHRIRP